MTFAVRADIPWDYAEYDEEALHQIELLVDLACLENAELVEGTGLVGNSYCDYDNGFCMPLPGYENADIRDGALVVYLLPGDEIEVMRPDGHDETVTVRRIVDEDDSEMKSCPHPKQRFFVDLGTALSDHDILRRKAAE